VYTPAVFHGAIAVLVVTGPAPDFWTASATLSSVTTMPSPLQMHPLSGALGSVAVGTIGPSVTFTVSNIWCPELGTLGPLTITLSTVELVITKETCRTSVLAAGESCTVAVALQPTSAGPKSAYLSVATADRSISAFLTGTGVDSSTDASIVSPLDGAGLDATSSNPVDGAGLDATSGAQGEALPAG
jgi:hypothetical protein